MSPELLILDVAHGNCAIVIGEESLSEAFVSTTPDASPSTKTIRYTRSPPLERTH